MSTASAIGAVVEKIAALAPTATPEQVAYLAKAAEAVAGHGTVQDVLAAGAQAVSEVNTAAASLLAKGWHTISIPGDVLRAALTAGAQYVVAEFGSDKVLDGGFAFDGAVGEFAWLKVRMPKSADIAAGFYFSVSWRHGSGATAWGVAFGLQALAVGSGEAIDGGLGTEQVVTGVGGTANVLYHTAFSAAPAVPAGGPATSDMVYLRLGRKPAHAADTLTIDAVVSGLTLLYRVTGANDE